MADVQSNIKVSIDTTDALASIKNLQRQISAFHTSLAKSGAAANAVTAGMQQNLINSINATGKFSAQMKTIRTTTESFTNSLEKNKFSLGEYFRYAGGASKTFGKLFKSEFETINKVARENVKDLQTQYIKMGRDANGAMKAIAVRPLTLDMNDLATKTMIASEKQALLNQLLKQGSTNLLNFGKNTQWAGRQLMVGFTIPLMAVGSAAAKTFMEMETQAIRFKKVYGDLFTPQAESVKALKDIQDLGKEFTKYGIAVSSTVGLAAEAAAAGFKGVDLQRQTAAATKLSILGQVESQKALETTISLQNAFAMSSDNLAESIDFLNAVENQTVLSLDDVSTAIPKAAPIVQQLGGDVKDLAFFMTAMKEGGINASEGANALKSGLASLINPTGKAAAMLEGFGINAKKIVVDNKGDLKKTVIEFATALNQLDPLNRAQAIEQMFGKFQFSRLSTLFANVTKDGTQAARVLDLAGSSVQELAALSEKELGMTSESAMNKFKASVENLKLALVPLGEEFLKAVTPVAEFVTKILDKFNNLGDGTKKIIVTMTAIVAGLGPVLLMTFGLLANGLANIIKGFTFMKTIFNKTGQSTATLGTEVKYMTLEQRNAAAVAASLDQVHKNLAQTFTSEAGAVNALTAAYQRAINAQAAFMPTKIPMGRGPITKRAKGKPAVVGGTGNQDSELAFLMPGETVIPTDMSKKYGSLINGMIADNIPGYAVGKPKPNTVASHIEGLTPAQLVTTLSDPIMKQVLEVLPDVGVGLQTLSTTADGMVTVSRTVETSLKNLSDSLSEKNIQDVTAIGTGGFAGTTIEASSERNLMLNAAGIAGDPITFEQMQEARNKAQSYIDRPVKNETDAVKAQRQEARNLIEEQLEFEKSLTGLSERDVEARKADFTKTKTTQALEYALRQKGLSASEASTLAKQQIADAEKATLKLVQGSKTELEKRKIKEAAYQATLLKEVGLVAGYDEKNTKTTVFNKTQLNAVTRDMAKGQVQFGTPYKAGEEVPQNIYDENGKVVQKGAAVFGSGKSFKGLSGGRISRNQSAVIDASIRDDYYADRNRAKDSFKNGSENGKAYNKGVQAARVPDIYEESRKRNSPHPLAPKDGKDDAKAYSEARNKEIKSQSGRTRRASSRPQGAPSTTNEVFPVSQSGRKGRRSASRPQGPSNNIGPLMPAGATELGLVSMSAGEKKELARQRVKNARLAKVKAMSSKVGRLGGGMGLMSANMALGSMPDFAGKGIIQSTMTGASMGMLFGPWGAAAGGAIGLVTTAMNKLIQKQKEHAATVKSTFQSSTAEVGIFGGKVLDASLKLQNIGVAIDGISTKFGNLNPQIQQFVDMVSKLDDKDPLKLFVEGLKTEKFSSLVGKIRARVTTQIASGTIDIKDAQKYVMGYLAAAGRANEFAEVWKKVSISVETSTKATEESFSKIYMSILPSLIVASMGLSNSVNKSFAGIGGFLNKYEDLPPILQAAADQMLNFAGVMSNGSLKLQDFNSRMAGLKNSAMNSKVGVDALAVAIRNTGNADSIAAFDRIRLSLQGINGDAAKATDAILLMTINSMGASKEVNDWGKKNAGRLGLNPMEMSQTSGSNPAVFKDWWNKVGKKRYTAWQKEQAAAIAAINGDTNPYVDPDTTTNATKAENPYLKILQKEIDILKAKRDAQKDANDELQRQIDLQNKMQDLSSQAVQAKISGNYIQASILDQESKNLQIKFNQETELKKKDAEIAALEARYQAIKNGAKLTAAESAKIPKKAAGGPISGPGTGTSDSIPALLSNGEYVIKTASVNKYGVDVFDALNAGRFAIGGIAGTPKPVTGGSIGVIGGNAKPAQQRKTMLETPYDSAKRLYQESNKKVIKIPVPPIRANFATNSYDLNKEQREELQAIAQQLIKSKLKSMVVQGHADSRGGVDNDLLSLNRAKATAAYLANLVPGTSFIPVGNGIYKPLVPNTSAANMALNRRAELFLPDQYKTIYPDFNPTKHQSMLIGMGSIPATRGVLGRAMGGLIQKFASGGMSNLNYKMPSYDVGIGYVPEDQIAQLHKGERVLTAEENRNFSNGPVVNNNNIYINGTDLNKKEIAQAVMVELDRAQKKNNKTNMVVM